MSDVDERASMDDLARALMAQGDALELERYVLSRYVEGVPAAERLTFGQGAPAEQTVAGDFRDPFQGVAIFNYSAAPLSVGFAAGAGVNPPLYSCPANTLLVLPVNFYDLSLAVSATDAAGGTALPVTVMRLRTAPLAPLTGTLQPSGVADVVDVADRAARLLGHVTVDNASLATDVSDRAARLLGHVAAIDQAVDVADRAARLLGHVTVDALPAADVTDRAARQLGVADVSDRAARLLGHVAAIDAAVDVADRAARVLGQVVDQRGIADTHNAFGTASPAAAGQVLASIAAPGAGVYAIQLMTIATGSPATTPNMQLRHGVTVAARLAQETAPVTMDFPRLTVAGGENIDVQIISADASTYTAVINATRIA